MTTKITDDVYYVGVNDRIKHRFEGLWPLPYGVSYNAFIVDDDKIALIDTVEVDFFKQFLENIQEAIGDRPIDYLIINHMEPDHSGSIALIKKYYPQIKIVGNKKTLSMLEGFYDVTNDVIEVKNGEVLQLGQHDLQFVLTPMVHWPETMVTLDVSHKIVYSGDAFGCFGALNGGVVDAEINCETFWLEMVRYYANIVGKYGTPVQAALKKLANVELDYICSTHGPIWHKHAAKVVDLYDRMSRYETEPGIVVCYGTMYGNTERMAEVIAAAASKEGVKNIVMYNVSKTHHSYILRDIFRYNGLIVGAPTYNNGLFHEMEILLSEIANRDIKNHKIAWYGSHCWSSKAVSKIEEWNNEHLHFTPVGTPVDMKQAITSEVRQQCEKLGREMAKSILS